MIQSKEKPWNNYEIYEYENASLSVSENRGIKLIEITKSPTAQRGGELDPPQIK